MPDFPPLTTFHFCLCLHQYWVYLTWEFYDAVVNEWISSAITGCIAVTVVGFFFIPHWTASLFVFPMIAVLYTELMGE